MKLALSSARAIDAEEMIKYHGEKIATTATFAAVYSRDCNDFYTSFCKGDALELVSKNQG